MKINCLRALIIISAIFIGTSAVKLNAQCTENFETVTPPALPTGWSAVTLLDCTGSNAWISYSTTPISGTRSAYVTSPGCVSDEVLYSRYYAISSASSQLAFSRKHEMEYRYDGMVLEISIGGGAFMDILDAGGSFVSGGYNQTLYNSLNPIGGRQAWTGNTTTVTTTVNLPSSANGQLVRFSWRRGTDASAAGTGAYIDNITISNCASAGACAENFSTITVPSLPQEWSAVTATDCASSNPWATTNALFDVNVNSAFVNGAGCISDEFMYSKLFQIISSSAQLSFRRNNVLELDYDGLVLEISIDGEAFIDIITAGGTFVNGAYNAGVISDCCGSPISGRSAWHGNSGGWVTTTINLPASAEGKIIILRWRRATDSSVETSGVYIDNVSITGSACVTSCAGTITVSPAMGSVCTGPQLLTATGGGPVYSWYRNHVLINGATSATYSATLEGIYYTKSLISGCLTTSKISVVAPGSIPPILTGGDTYCIGTTVNIGMTDTEDDQSYTWRHNGAIVHTVPAGSGGGSKYFTFTMDAGKVGAYQVETTRPGCMSTVSNFEYVGAPIITGLSVLNNCSNELTVKWNRVVPESEFQLYEYQLDNSPTPPTVGSNTSDSALLFVSLNPNTQYYFHVRSQCSSSNWGAWGTLPVMTTVSLGLAVTAGSLCEVPATLTASGGSGVYTWFRNGTPIPGVTSNTYEATQFGTYQVTSANGTCNNQSGEVVLEGLVSPFLEGNGVYCTGAIADMRVYTEIDQSYAWYKVGNPDALRTIPIGGGGGNQSLAVAVSASTEGSYYVETARTGCPALTSSNAYVDQCKITYLTVDYVCPTSVKFRWNSTSYFFEYIVNQISTPSGTPLNTSDHEMTFSGLLPSTTYYIHVQGRTNGDGGSSFCGSWSTISFTTPAATLPPATAVWTGAVSSIWTNAANWQCGVVPGNTTEVIVNGFAPNNPIVSSNTTIRKLTANFSATVTVNPGVVLTITGY